MKQVYSRLSAVKGVEYTGGSKVMHLLNPKLFLIWDTAMREHYGYSDATANEYLEYHKLLQKRVRGVKWHSESKTLPKAIDEYHYYTITSEHELP